MIRTFEISGKKYDVRKPGIVEQREGQKVYNKAVSDALQSGAILSQTLEKVMRQQNLWDDTKEFEFKTLQAQISETELKLEKGGITRSNARQLCLDLRGYRYKLQELISIKSDLDVLTCQGQGNNTRFNYWVSACLVYNDTGKPVYKDLNDYTIHNTDDVAISGANKLAELVYGLDENYEEKLVENRVLKKLKMVDDKYRLIDKDGNLVNSKGKRINEDGRLINDQGQVIDENGNPVGEDGNHLVNDPMPFLEDDGLTPIQE